MLRPPIAQERLEPRPDGLVRITLKRAYADGTVAVDMRRPTPAATLEASPPLPASSRDPRNHPLIEGTIVYDAKNRLADMAAMVEKQKKKRAASSSA